MSPRLLLESARALPNTDASLIDVRRTVLHRRADIIAAGQSADVDPGVIAAIAFVTQREQVTPIRQRAEEVAISTWLQDPKSNFLLGVPFNVSIGLTQIKPVTAQTALQLTATNGTSTTYSKEYREVPHLRWSLPDRATSTLQLPLRAGSGKVEVVQTLIDDEGNLKFCALILGVYQVPWAGATPSVDIRNRPDILGTLFQIGFERSHPHPDPRNNDFGTRVQRVYDSDWVREAFPRRANPEGRSARSVVR